MSGVKERAQELLAARLEVVTDLESAHTRLTQAQQDVRSAESAVSTTWKAAVDAGWTDVELRRLGFVAPSPRRGGRPTVIGGRRSRAAGYDAPAAD